MNRLPTRRIELEIAGRHLTFQAPADRTAARRNPSDRATWAVPWPAGLLLAERVARSLPWAAVELGCGLGVVGTVAALSLWDVTFTDADPRAVEFALANALANGAPPERVRAHAMDWTLPSGGPFPRVLASDVLYERRLHAPLLGAIEALLAPGGEAWVADPLRPSATAFPDLARARGFRVETEPLGSGQRCAILYVLRHRNPATPGGSTSAGPSSRV